MKNPVSSPWGGSTVSKRFHPRLGRWMNCVIASLVLVGAAGSFVNGRAAARDTSGARREVGDANGPIIASVDRSLPADQIRDAHGDMNLFAFSSSGVVHQLTDTFDDDYAAEVSPDGRLIAFTRGLSMNGTLGDIYTLDTGSGEVTNLTQTPALHEYGPTWSPDAELIAFSRSDPDTPGGDLRNDDLYIVGADGGEPTRLTKGPNIEMGPAWSPRGDTIAYLEHDVGGPYARGRTRLRLTEPDSSSDKVILTENRYLTSLSWSPGGGQLAVTMVPGGNDSSGGHSIWLLERNGSEFRQVLPRASSLNAMLGTWSPDGRWIAFVGRHAGLGGGSRLYKMRPDGSQVTRMSDLNLSTAGQESLISGVPWKIDWAPRR